MLLDSRQRLIFIEWCKSQADGGRGIADQIEKLMAHSTADVIAKRERQKAVAFSIVAMELAASIVAMELAEFREEFSVKASDAERCPDDLVE